MLGLAKRDWLLVGLAAILPVLGFKFDTEFQAALIVGRGTNGGCSWQEVREGALVLKEENDLRLSYARGSRILERDEAGLYHWRTPAADYWTPASDVNQVTVLIAEQQREIYGTGRQGVRPGDLVLDCGANVGVYTRFALKAGARQVIAIEPEPKNVECLRRNLAGEVRGGRVRIVNMGVWDKEDSLEMQEDSTNAGGHSFAIQRESGRRTVRLPLTTIDKLVAELGIERVDFIKMDIEGAERNALAGARETIRRFHPRMAISVYHLPDDQQVIDQRVKEAWPGYRMLRGTCYADWSHARPEVFFYE